MQKIGLAGKQPRIRVRKALIEPWLGPARGLRDEAVFAS
jgi:hypothetical protein